MHARKGGKLTASFKESVEAEGPGQDAAFCPLFAGPCSCQASTKYSVVNISFCHFIDAKVLNQYIR